MEQRGHSIRRHVLAKVTLLGLLISSASASQPEFSAVWSNSSRVTESANCSFLNDVQYSERDSFFATMMDRQTELNLTQQYEDMNRDYDLKRHFGLADREMEEQHVGDMSHFSRQVFGEMRRYQIRKESANLREALQREDGLRELLTPVGIIGAGADIYNGTPVNYQFDDTTRFRAVTNVRARMGQFSLLASIGTTSLDWNLNGQDPNLPFTPEISGNTEKYKLSFNRALPMWDMMTGFFYGGTTGSIGATFSKLIAPNLSAILDVLRPIQQGTYYNEETLRFCYAAQF